MKIVIVEDEEVLLAMLKEKFKAAGFYVGVAKDAVEAIPVIKKERPEIILLDLLLPKGSGFDVLQKLKSTGDLKDIPVAILSNLGDGETIKKGLRMGAIEYLVKVEVSLNEVVERVKLLVLEYSK